MNIYNWGVTLFPPCTYNCYFIQNTYQCSPTVLFNTSLITRNCNIFYNQSQVQDLTNISTNGYSMIAASQDKIHSHLTDHCMMYFYSLGWLLFCVCVRWWRHCYQRATKTPNNNINIPKTINESTTVCYENVYFWF